MKSSKPIFLTLLLLFFLVNNNLIKAQYNWYQFNNYGGSVRYGAVNFVIGHSAYVGLGKNTAGYLSDFWKYEASTDTWTKIADFGGAARAYAVSFTINNKAYVATGENGSTRYKDLWEYDPALNQWTQKALFGGTARSRAVGFAIENKAYLGTGYDGTEKKDFWEYDPSLDSWVQKADLASDARQQAIGFAVNGKGYICAGATYSSGTMMTNDVYEYNPVLNTWAEKSFAESHLARTNATSFVLNNKAYICGGLGKKDFWEYDPMVNLWYQKADFGLASETNRIDATGFSLDGKGYIVTGEYMVNFSTTILKNDVWAYSTPLPPKPPSNLKVTSALMNSICLGWWDNASDETFFIVERSIGDNTKFVKIDSLTTNRTNYLNSNLYDSTLYFYRVRAGNSGGYSAYSNETSTSTLFGNPSSLAAIPISSKKIDLFWQDNSIWDVKYYIERSKTDNVHFTLVDSIASSLPPEWSDTTLTDGEKSFYRVFTKYKGQKKYSNENYAIAMEQGSWRLMKDMPHETGSGCFSFMIGKKYYVGLNSYDAINAFYEYDTEKDTWTPKTSYPGKGKYYPSAFSINDKGYVGLGKDTQMEGSNLYSDFWEYDPLNDKWTQKADFGGSVRNLATSLTIGDKGYLGFGYNTNFSTYLSDLWQYNATSNTWTRMADCPETFKSPVSFAINTLGYVGFGYSSNSLYSFNPATNIWTKKQDFTESLTEDKNWYYLHPFTISNKAFLIISRKNSFWEYDEVNDKWIRKNGYSNVQWPYIGIPEYISGSNGSVAYFHPSYENVIGYNNNNGGSNRHFYQFNPLAPATPTNLKITDYTNASISLKWVDNSNKETNYLIERTSSSSYYYTTIDTINANLTTYIDKKVSANTQYYYRVSAINNFGQSGYSNEVFVRTGVPYRGEIKSVISKYNENKVYIEYNVTNDAADGYILERSENSDPTNFTLVDTFNNTIKQFIDSNLVLGRWYNYRLKAYNKLGNSGYSPVAKIIAGSVSIYNGTLKTDQTTLFDNAGYNLEYDHCNTKTLTVFPQTAGTKISISFNEMGINTSDTLLIYNGTSINSPLISKLTGNIVPNSLICSDNPNGAITLKFKPNCSGWSILNTGWMATIKSYLHFPPSNLTAATNTSNCINLKWADNASDETYYIIERSLEDNMHFVKLDSVVTNTKSYSDFAVTSNQQYYYRVKAKTGAIYTDYSNQILTMPIPASPSNLTINVANALDVLLTWQDNSDNEKMFIISVSPADSLHYANLDSVALNNHSYTKKNFYKDYVYYFRVKASNIGGYSDTKSVPFIFLYRPTNLALASNNGATSTLSWKDNSYKEGNYVVERSTNDSLHFAVLATLPANSSTYQDTSAAKNINYYYRVKAIHLYGESFYSSLLNVKNGTTGVAEINQFNEIEIFPNPTKEVIYLRIDQKSNARILEINIFDSKGSKLKTVIGRNLSADKPEVNVSDLVPGVYYLQIAASDKIITKTFIKQ